MFEGRCDVEQTTEALMHRLRQIATDLRSQMAEVQALRAAVQAEEAAQRGQEPIRSAVLGTPGHERRV